VWAVWAPGGDRKVTVKIGSGLQQAVDFLGAPLPVTETTRTLSIGPGITYLVGPKTLDIH